MSQTFKNSNRLISIWAYLRQSLTEFSHSLAKFTVLADMLAGLSVAGCGKENFLSIEMGEGIARQRVKISSSRAGSLPWLTLRASLLM